MTIGVVRPIASLPRGSLSHGEVLQWARHGQQHIQEGKNAIRWTRLSCHAFRHNAVRLQLHALAYNLANFLRTPALPADVEHWSLNTLREKLVKIGARIVRHGRYVVFQLAEVAVPRALLPRSCAGSTSSGRGLFTHDRGALDTGIGAEKCARRARVNSVDGSGGTFATAETQPGEAGTALLCHNDLLGG